MNNSNTTEQDLTIGTYAMEGSEDIMKPILQLKESDVIHPEDTLLILFL